MNYKFSDKKSAGSGFKNMPNEILAVELHKSIIKKKNKRIVHSFFKDNIWSVDLDNMQLISKFDKGIRFLLCVSDFYYVLCVKILDELNQKPNKVWIDKCSKFYNISIKLWLHDNETEIYSRHNEGKSLL